MVCLHIKLGWYWNSFVLSSNEEVTASAVPFCLICVEKVIFLFTFISLLNRENELEITTYLASLKEFIESKI